MKYETGTKLTGNLGDFTLIDCEHCVGTQESNGDETWLYYWSTSDGDHCSTTSTELSALIADGASLQHQ